LVFKKKKITSNFIETAGKINIKMPKKIFNQIKKIFNHNNITKKSNILFLGLSYKKNIGDLRNSPSLEIFEYLIKENYNIQFNDDFVKKVKLKNKIFLSKNINSIKNNKVIILSTNHDYYKKVKFNNRDLIIDLRNFFIKNKKT
jgi:UDP-N-acetyl-D-glucosamine dehydrogenase